VQRFNAGTGPRFVGGVQVSTRQLRYDDDGERSHIGRHPFSMQWIAVSHPFGLGSLTVGSPDPRAGGILVGGPPVDSRGYGPVQHPNRGSPPPPMDPARGCPGGPTPRTGRVPTARVSGVSAVRLRATIRLGPFGGSKRRAAWGSTFVASVENGASTLAAPKRELRRLDGRPSAPWRTFPAVAFRPLQ
jgi:hypothetical protein